LVGNYDKLCIISVARGLQTSSGNANYLDLAGTKQLLADSPTDGGFGYQKNCFDTKIIQSKASALIMQINSGTRSGSIDYDDFEVFNLTARLEEKNGKVDVLPALLTKPFDPLNNGTYALNTLPKRNAAFELNNGYYPVGTAKVVWNFGDGTAASSYAVASNLSDFPVNPVATYTTHDYVRSGSFTIRISYQDPSGKELAASTYVVTVI
jgi:hypothetical protein